MNQLVKKQLSLTSCDLRIVTPITHEAVAIPIRLSKIPNDNNNRKYFRIIYTEKVIVVQLYSV